MISPTEIAQLDFGAYEKLVLYTIHALGMVPTARVLAEKCGCSVRRIRTAFKTLRDAGLIAPVPVQPAYVLCAPPAPRAPHVHEDAAQVDVQVVQPECTTCTPEPKTAEIRHFLPALVVSEKQQNSAILGEGRGGIIGGGGEGATSYHTDFNPPYLPIEGRKGGVGGKQNSGFELEPTAAPASRTPRTSSKRTLDELLGDSGREASKPSARESRKAREITFSQFMADSPDGKVEAFRLVMARFKAKGWGLPDMEEAWENFYDHWTLQKPTEKKITWPLAFYNWVKLVRGDRQFQTEEQRNARRRAGGRQNTIDDIAEQKRKALHEYAMFKARQNPDGIFGRRLAEAMADGADVGASETERARIAYDPGSF